MTKIDMISGKTLPRQEASVQFLVVIYDALAKNDKNNKWQSTALLSTENK